VAFDLRGPTIDQAWSSGRNHFNLIRLIAAWMVIYGHAWAITAAPGGDWFTVLTQFKFAGGIAVDMFFVISGFLIAASLQRNDVRGFLASRALRILPALAVCVGLSTFVLGPLLTTSPDYWRLPQTWQYFVYNATLHRAEFFLPGVFETLPRSAINGSLWTLPIEAQLYVALLIAGLLGFVNARRYAVPWLLLLAAVGVAILAGVDIPEARRNELWCLLFFVSGTGMWLYRDRIRLSWVAILALLVCAYFTRGHGNAFGAVYFVLVCYGTLWLAFTPPAVPRLAHHDVSYGLYLYGWPVAQLVQMYSPGSPLHNTLWASVFAFACAALSWFLIERPALRMKRRFGTRTPAASPATAGL
jgi:peptidoglycan/LPS O-acetylase OafA/YrhL